MFTFRAEMEKDGDYALHTAGRYVVEKQEKRRVVLLFDGNELQRSLLVGRQPDGLFSVVYVMNAAGKTVDTIR